MSAQRDSTKLIKYILNVPSWEFWGIKQNAHTPMTVGIMAKMLNYPFMISVLSTPQFSPWCSAILLLSKNQWVRMASNFKSSVAQL